nr:DNA repair protein RadC [uncultured Acetatifactor sp.]
MDKSKEKNREKKTDLPYERFLRFGPENLTERELLAIIIRTGTKDQSALQLAENVLGLARYPREGLLGLYDVSIEELKSIKGIGEVKAIKLKCLTELSMRISTATAREGICFHDSAAVARYFMEKLRHRDTECVILVCLDAKGQMIEEKRLSEGSVRMSLISPREVFLEALKSRAVHILLVHNHPSGNPAPSRADIELTQNIRELGEKMDISLLDHIIIGDNRYTSLKEAAYL